MIITIDTQKDSKDEMQKIIALLNNMIGEAKEEQQETKQAIGLGSLQEEPENKTGVRKTDEGIKKSTDELLKMIAPKKEKDITEGIPKSVKEAYELADDLETY